MSHWKNFPASDSMTEFEIVVVQNERARWRRERMGQQQVSSDSETHYENAEDALVTNILLKADPAHVPVLLTPIHPTPSPTPGLDVTSNQEEPSLSRDNQDEILSLSVTSNEDDNDVYDQEHSHQLTQMELNMVSNDTSSSGSYQSVHSSHTPTKKNSSSEEMPIHTITEKDQHNHKVAMPIPFHGNSTMFMTDINKMNVNKKTRTTLISAVRPSFHCPQNEFFICHVCHRKPKQIKIVEDLWNRKIENNNNLGDEISFPYNLRGIIDHLTNHHCLTHEDKSRDMIVAVAIYIDMVNKDIEMFSSPMFHFENSIPKASSTSCLHVSWKTDQPELTKALAHKYNFHDHTSYCAGHPKSSAPKQTDFKDSEFELDLANTVYCSCSAPTIDLEIMDRPSKPVAEEIFDLKLNVSQETTFFNQERKSIKQSHKAILCHFKIQQPLPKFEPRTYQPAKPITRKDTRDKLLQDSHQENQQQNSSEATTSGNNQTNQKQQDLPRNSCKIPPPGEVRLRPEGKSPPMPPPLEQGQPPADPSAGNSIVAKVGHAMATAGFLLKKPARKSDWV